MAPADDITVVQKSNRIEVEFNIYHNEQGMLWWEAILGAKWCRRHCEKQQVYYPSYIVNVTWLAYNGPAPSTSIFLSLNPLKITPIQFAFQCAKIITCTQWVVDQTYIYHSYHVYIVYFHGLLKEAVDWDLESKDTIIWEFNGQLVRISIIGTWNGNLRK